MGATLLFAVVVGSLAIGLVLLGRPATAERAARAAEAAARLPEPSAWPVAAALAVVLLLTGVAVDVPLLVLGFGALALSVAGWFTQAWREHAARADPTAIEAHRRILWPTGVPLLAFTGIAVVVISFSRILLAVSKDAAVALALVAAVGILMGCAAVALRPRLNAGLVASAAAVIVAAVVVGGVVAAAQGERDFHPAPAHAVAEAAKGVAFTKKKLTVPAAGQTVISFQNNDDQILHNVAVYTDKSGDDLVYFGNAVMGPGHATYRFPTPRPGEYFFRCEFHIATMTGTLVVLEPGTRAHEER
jgi:plastocyanin